MTHDIYEPCGSRMYGGMISQVLIRGVPIWCVPNDILWHSAEPI